MPHAHPRRLAATGAALALALAGCVANNPAGAAVTVTINDTTCLVSPTTASAGTVRFTLTNSGSDTNEFEIYDSTQQRIVSEKESVTPGQTIQHVVQLNAGTYYTGCRFRQAGDLIGVAAFTVDPADPANPTGPGLPAELADTAIATYLAYVRAEADSLVAATTAFTAAYAGFDDVAAQGLYAPARAGFEHIEPIAESFGDLDPRIDAREVDVTPGDDWTGFHRLEKDLWPPAPGALNVDGTDAHQGWTASTPTQRGELAAQLVADVTQLRDLVAAPDFTVTVSDIANGAIALLDEVSASKITGEEDWWSHTDLADFDANVEGAWVAFSAVADLADAQGASGQALVAQITAEFTSLRSLLAQYGNPVDGYLPYTELTDADRQGLSNALNGLAEPASQLTATILQDS